MITFEFTIPEDIASANITEIDKQWGRMRSKMIRVRYFTTLRDTLRDIPEIESIFVHHAHHSDPIDCLRTTKDVKEYRFITRKARAAERKTHDHHIQFYTRIMVALKDCGLSYQTSAVVSHTFCPQYGDKVEVERELALYLCGRILDDAEFRVGGAEGIKLLRTDYQAWKISANTIPADGDGARRRL